MLKGREIVSLPIITLEDNKQVGEVKSIIYDQFSGSVLGYVVENKGWLRDARVIAHQDIEKITPDAMFISNCSAIKKIDTMPVLKEHLYKNDIMGMRIEDVNGCCIGVIQDLVLEGTSGKITGFEVSDGVVQDLLSGRFTIPRDEIKFYEDKLVIENDY